MRLLFLCLIFFATACNQQNASESGKGPELRLGSSEYYINLPTQFKLTEARGKEGQLGYNIIPQDSTSTMFGFVEIVSGNPIASRPSEIDTAKTYKNTLLDGKKIDWKLYHGESGYFTAFTTEKGELNARVSAKQLSEVDSLISIISTLRKK